MGFAYRNPKLVAEVIFMCAVVGEEKQIIIFYLVKKDDNFVRVKKNLLFMTMFGWVKLNKITWEKMTHKKKFLSFSPLIINLWGPLPYKGAFACLTANATVPP